MSENCCFIRCHLQVLSHKTVRTIRNTILSQEMFSKLKKELQKLLTRRTISVVLRIINYVLARYVLDYDVLNYVLAFKGSYGKVYIYIKGSKSLKMTQQLFLRDWPSQLKMELNTFFCRCKCGHCHIELLQSNKECYCCTEVEGCMAALNDALVLQDVSEPPPCITLHPGFRVICLEKYGH